jgi:hypothetical protein
MRQQTLYQNKELYLNFPITQIQNNLLSTPRNVYICHIGVWRHGRSPEQVSPSVSWSQRIGYTECHWNAPLLRHTSPWENGRGLREQNLANRADVRAHRSTLKLKTASQAVHSVWEHCHATEANCSSGIVLSWHIACGGKDIVLLLGSITHSLWCPQEQVWGGSL